LKTTDFDAHKALKCKDEVDRARVHPTLSNDDVERDWRQCWKRPFLKLIDSYHCDQTWRQVLSSGDVNHVRLVPKCDGYRLVWLMNVVVVSLVTEKDVDNGVVMMTLGTGEVALFKACGGTHSNNAILSKLCNTMIRKRRSVVRGSSVPCRSTIWLFSHAGGGNTRLASAVAKRRHRRATTARRLVAKQPVCTQQHLATTTTTAAAQALQTQQQPQRKEQSLRQSDQQS
jgi:hypothetical protein